MARSTESIDIAGAEWWTPPVENRGGRIQTTGAPFQNWGSYRLIDPKFATVQMVSDLLRVNKSDMTPLEWVFLWGFPLNLGHDDVYRQRGDTLMTPKASCEPLEILELANNVAEAVETLGSSLDAATTDYAGRIMPVVDLIQLLNSQLNALVISIFPRFDQSGDGQLTFDRTGKSPLTMFMRPDSLQQAVWLHVAWLGTGLITSNIWRHCAECDTWIFPLDKRQRFCLPYRHRIKASTFSKCQQRNSKRRQRNHD
jgi:hypothetical protein